MKETKLSFLNLKEERPGALTEGRERNEEEFFGLHPASGREADDAINGRSATVATTIANSFFIAGERAQAFCNWQARAFCHSIGSMQVRLFRAPKLCRHESR